MKITRLTLVACLTDRSEFEVTAEVTAGGQDFSVLYTLVNVSQSGLTGSDLMIQVGKALVKEGRRTR
jgi:hypothetical protein